MSMATKGIAELVQRRLSLLQESSSVRIQQNRQYSQWTAARALSSSIESDSQSGNLSQCGKWKILPRQNWIVGMNGRLIGKQQRRMFHGEMQREATRPTMPQSMREHMNKMMTEQDSYISNLKTQDVETIKEQSKNQRTYMSASFLKATYEFKQNPTKVVASALIARVSVEGTKRALDEAFSLYEAMLKKGVMPDSVVYTSLIVACWRCGDPERSLKLIYDMEKFSVYPDENCLQWLISAAADFQDVKSAHKLFGLILRKPPPKLSVNNVCYAQLIKIFANATEVQNALKVFNFMNEFNVRPTPATYTSLLAMLGNASAVNHGIKIHEYILNNTKLATENEHIIGSLINFYSKCGRLESAKSIFQEALNGPFKKDLSVWNAMMIAYGLHGQAEDAWTLFQKMQSSQVKPDRITFKGLLSALAQAGKAQRAVQVISMMKPTLGKKPSLVNQDCVVRAFARAGKVEEAEKWILSLERPVYEHWVSLLAGSIKFKDLVFSSRIATKALKSIQVQESDMAHQLLYILHGLAGKQKERAIALTKIDLKAIERNTLQEATYLELDEQIIKFTSSSTIESVHEQADKYREIAANAGHKHHTAYHTDPNHYHSEELAVAYALSRTAKGSTILVSKNEKICFDCHSLFKVLSKTEQRTIVVRDSITFHQLTDGICSCGDVL